MAALFSGLDRVGERAGRHDIAIAVRDPVIGGKIAADRAGIVAGFHQGKIFGFMVHVHTSVITTSVQQLQLQVSSGPSASSPGHFAPLENVSSIGTRSPFIAACSVSDSLQCAHSFSTVRVKPPRCACWQASRTAQPATAVARDRPNMAAFAFQRASP